MKKPREYETHAVGRGGWTGWIAPVMRGYFMKCCDCGLVHELQFKVVQQTTPAKRDGTWDARAPRANGLRAMFRARRA